MASRGFEAWGLDFAPAMIELCERKAAGDANAHFQQASFFDFPAEDGAYALLSAQGLIEYISPEQLDELFAKTIRMLRPGGAFVVGSRNRLFNVFSLSAYTELELKLGSTAGLIGEALALVSAADQAGAMEAVRRLNANYPLVSSHPLTGIGVDTRHQYAPSELIRRAEAAGYRADLISPVHYHCFCVPAAQRKKEVYVPFAEMMAEEGAEDHRLIPYSSTFVLTAVKP
jgi:2-polyprenyl-3-methyl-5-hydroxy-6-metoxy-1,4-benzoquinol methylase